MPFAACSRWPRRIAAATALVVPLAAGAAGADAERAARLREEAIALELGDGVPKDEARAVALYCDAARLGDADAQYRLGWLYANGTGVARSEAAAAFFFGLAAGQGVPQAANMLRVVGGPSDAAPACMREPKAPVVVRVDAPVAPSAVLDATAEPMLPPSVAPPHIVRLVQRMAPEYHVEPRLALAIIQAESNFDTIALSPKNAMGLMQLIPETAARFNVRNPWDATQNIRGGLAYLRWLLAYFEGDVQLVAAAYNAGEGAVERHGGVPPYEETRAYVRRILEAVGRAAHPYDASVTPPSPLLPRLRTPGRR